MERTRQCGYALLFAAIVASAILSSAFCVAAEFRKSKKNDLKFDGKLCYLPGSDAFEFGIAALICLAVGQMTGSLFVCGSFRRGSRRKLANPTVPCGLTVFSWVSFGIAVILISTATSMSRSQAYGEGWLDGECYLVKDGVYVGGGVLALLAAASTVGSAGMKLREKKAEEKRKVHSNNSNAGLEEHMMK